MRCRVDASILSEGEGSCRRTVALEDVVIIVAVGDFGSALNFSVVRRIRIQRLVAAASAKFNAIRSELGRRPTRCFEDEISEAAIRCEERESVSSAKLSAFLDRQRPS